MSEEHQALLKEARERQNISRMLKLEPEIKALLNSCETKKFIKSHLGISHDFLNKCINIMNQDKEELFNSWLSEYQTDFLKIVNKYRLERHPLSVNEIISEINMGILKEKKIHLFMAKIQLCLLKLILKK